ncbi:unnamed protein product [Adineta ricciae]|uniref:Uncharacterized protein n=1 Tax=Adineta ricciae TaxID=249248 RepID=A0A815VFV7_ADIRI|nr:unnamed protein product [Adineta ricciae]
MASKRFKTLSGFVTNVSPVKEGKNKHNWAEGLIQTGSGNEEKVICGCVVKLNPIKKIDKYDNGTQQKVEKLYRTGIVADGSGAVMVMFWQELADAVCEGVCINLSNMRATVDGHGTPYFTTTFRTVLKNLLETNINYDEEAAEALYDCELTLFQQVTGTVDSV